MIFKTKDLFELINFWHSKEITGSARGNKTQTFLISQFPDCFLCFLSNALLQTSSLFTVWLSNKFLYNKSENLNIILVKGVALLALECIKIGPSGAQYYFCFNLHFFSKQKNH